MRYEAKGAVRGGCGHRHRSIDGALRCAERDQRSCSKLGGGAYSDRTVCREDGQPLDDDEMHSLEVLRLDRDQFGN
jgi:hypothetical protein